MTMRICLTKGCENKHYCQGYCKKHYTRLCRHGDPFYTKIERHGMTHTPEYVTWKCIKARCYNKNKYFYCYGGRGITVCDKWRNSFTAFLNDMGKRPFLKATIDRIDNNGNYEPENCRWTTNAENNQNKSNNKLSMRKVIKIRKLDNNISAKDLAVIYKV
ncbi:hypothetical protein LCGC14_2988180, partial [marine sediment metagenome]